MKQDFGHNQLLFIWKPNQTCVNVCFEVFEGHDFHESFDVTDDRALVGGKVLSRHNSLLLRPGPLHAHPENAALEDSLLCESNQVSGMPWLVCASPNKPQEGEV
jgi:hypothetical protein